MFEYICINQKVNKVSIYVTDINKYYTVISGINDVFCIFT